MTEDISKKTIMVLVALTIIVSALGTLTVLDSVNNANIQTVPAVQEEGSTEASGLVTLKINEPVEVAGNVILNLVRT